MNKTKDLSLCLWSDLKKHDIDSLCACCDSAQTHQFISNFFSFSNKTNGRILGDLFFGAYKFGQVKGFGPAQVSTFLSILKRIHDLCVSTPFGNFEECVTYFKQLLVLHAIHRPPWTLKIFDTQQAQLVSDFITDGYFRHYKLYKYAFTSKIKLDLVMKYEGVPIVPEIVVDLVDNKAGENQEVEGPIAEPSGNVEDIKADNELEEVIKQAITDQLKNLHADVDRQLEEADIMILNKIRAMHGIDVDDKGGKSAKGGKK